MTENPYQPPKVTVSDPVDTSESRLVDPRKLSAGRGWGWVQGGFKYFLISPTIWIVNVMILSVIKLTIGLIPLLGGLVNSILAPVFAGGLMLGCSAQGKGEQLKINHLFKGFQKNTGNLILAGILFFVAIFVLSIVVLFLVIALGGGEKLLVSLMESGASPSLEKMQSLNAVGSVSVLGGLALIIPLVMAYFFAPVLIVHYDLGAIKAMKLSFKGCLRNVIPFLVYGVVFLLLLVLVALPAWFGLGIYLSGNLGGSILLLIISILALLPLFSVVLTSIYVAYKEIFTEKIG